jgi:hypothetical protein
MLVSLLGADRGRWSKKQSMENVSNNANIMIALRICLIHHLVLVSQHKLFDFLHTIYSPKLGHQIWILVDFASSSRIHYIDKSWIVDMNFIGSNTNDRA